MNTHAYTLEYSGPYGRGSMIFDNLNTAEYWTRSFLRGGNTRVTLRKLCKRHARFGSSERHGKCCKILQEG